MPVDWKKQDSTISTPYQPTRNKTNGISITEQLNFPKKKIHAKSDKFPKASRKPFTMTKRFRSAQKLMSLVWGWDFTAKVAALE